jgi:hypothetical protein
MNQPPNLKIELFQHQLLSISKMERLEADRTIIADSGRIYRNVSLGINSDMTGYGKTLSMIGLIIRDRMPWDLSIPYVIESVDHGRTNSLLTSYMFKRYPRRLPTTLVLVSTTLLTQWVKELEYSELTVKTVTKQSDLDDIFVENYDVVLSTPVVFNKLTQMYESCVWKRFIYDEPSYVVVPGMKKFTAGFSWFLSATPDQIFYRHYKCGKGMFMRDIVGESTSKFTDIINDISIENDPEFVKKSFAMPKTIHKYYECYNHLTDLISGHVTDAVKQHVINGDIDSAIEALGGDRTSNIVELIKTKKQNEYNLLEAKKQKIITYGGDIDTLLEKQKRITEQMSDISAKYDAMLCSDCVICQERIKEPVLEPNCQNIFCGKCLLTWLEKKETCPMCRIGVKRDCLIYIVTDKNSVESHPKPKKIMTKLDTIVDILRYKPYGKFIIFSDFERCFSSIINILDENKLSYVLLRGNLKSIDSKLDSFKHGSTQVILLNSVFYGAGLNLQEATDIIIYHDMSESSKTQIIGRANRIGRIGELTVHHLY